MKKLLIKQSKNSFIRCTERYGYITNQLTRHDRSYDRVGAIFLSQITRKARPISEIVEALVQIFEDVEEAELTKDYIEFAKSLSDDKFVLLGYDESEMDLSDASFTYDIDNPKTLASDYTQLTAESVKRNTQDFFLEEVQGRPLISALQFELSSRCNERCIHCYIPNQKKDHGFDMPTSKVLSILDEFSEMGGLHVTLSGGEAFLHKDIIKIVRYCREKDLKVTILSNLLTLTDNQVKELANLNVSLIQTSLYSMDPEIHDQITTVKGSWTKTMSAIERLIEANVPVQISCPLMKANKDGYREVLLFAQSKKIKAQTDYIMMGRADLTTDNLAQRLSLEETANVIRDIIEFDLDYLEDMVKVHPVEDDMEFDMERFLKQPVCGVGYDNCCITANGDVYPCAGWQGYVLGNVYKSSLSDIWENSDRIKELRMITEASFPECAVCEARQYCARCLVRNFNECDGDMFGKPQHFCDVAFLNKALVEEYEEKYAPLIRDDIKKMREIRNAQKRE